jgi:soluble lytic murein transglycosylase-like protein
MILGRCAKAVARLGMRIALTVLASASAAASSFPPSESGGRGAVAGALPAADAVPVVAYAAVVPAAPAPLTCWEQAALRHQVNPHLLVAIAQVESGLRAHAIGRNTNGSIDIGLMQINTLWLPELARHGITARDLLDPCVSVHVGAWVLAQKMRRHGNTWTAVGAYNAGSDVLRERYARRVVQALERRAANAR